MKKLPHIILPILMAACAESENQFTVTNSSDRESKQVVEFQIKEWNLPASRQYVAEGDGGVKNMELIDMDGDLLADKASLLVNLGARESKSFRVRAGEEVMPSKKMTQAELSIKKGGEWKDRKYEGGSFENVTSLRVPDQHTDHSYFIRYEGPGWESDKAAYRFYLDWRNGVDYFGKKTPEMVLQNVGQDGFDSYHEPAEWGMDLLKVGQTLGLGSIGRYSNDSLYRFRSVDSVICAISKNGIFRSEVTTTYFGWETTGEDITLTSVLSIEAGSPATAHLVQLSKPIEGFCTGLVKSAGEDFIDKTEGGYRALATFGKFSLAKDGMGLGLIVKNEDIDRVFDGAGSHVVTFKPTDEVTYYFFAAWEQDYSGVKTMQDFEKLLDDELTKLNFPFTVELE